MRVGTVVAMSLHFILDACSAVRRCTCKGTQGEQRAFVRGSNGGGGVPTDAAVVSCKCGEQRAFVSSLGESGLCGGGGGASKRCLRCGGGVYLYKLCTESSMCVGGLGNGGDGGK
jgi:hypothetical protein